MSENLQVAWISLIASIVAALINAAAVLATYILSKRPPSPTNDPKNILRQLREAINPGMILSLLGAGLLTGILVFYVTKTSIYKEVAPFALILRYDFETSGGSSEFNGWFPLRR